MGLENGPVQAQQQPEPGGDHGEGDTAVVGQPQGVGDRRLDGDGDDRPDGHPEDGLAVQAGGPGLGVGAVTERGHGGDPPHHADQEGRAGHREHEVEADQLGHPPVLVRREQPGHHHGGHDVEGVGDETAHGEGTRLEDPAQEGLRGFRALRAPASTRPTPLRSRDTGR